MQHEVYIADIAAGCLLGWDFIKGKGCIIDASRNTLWMQGDSTTLLEKPGPISCYRVVLEKPIVIPPESEVVAKATVLGQPQGDVTWVGEGIPRFMAGKGVLVAGTVVDPSRVQVPARMINLGGEPKEVQHSTVIGRLEHLSEVKDGEGDMRVRPCEFK